MIVTDLDGTYLRTDKTISEYSRKIITECRNKGLLFIIATARPIRAVKDFLSESDYDGAIFHNGAVVKLGDEPFSGFGIPNPGKSFPFSWTRIPDSMPAWKCRTGCM